MPGSWPSAKKPLLPYLAIESYLVYSLHDFEGSNSTQLFPKSHTSAETVAATTALGRLPLHDAMKLLQVTFSEEVCSPLRRNKHLGYLFVGNVRMRCRCQVSLEHAQQGSAAVRGELPYSSGAFHTRWPPKNQVRARLLRIFGYRSWIEDYPRDRFKGF